MTVIKLCKMHCSVVQLILFVGVLVWGKSWEYGIGLNYGILMQNYCFLYLFLFLFSLVFFSNSPFVQSCIPCSVLSSVRMVMRMLTQYGQKDGIEADVLRNRVRNSQINHSFSHKTYQTKEIDIYSLILGPEIQAS